MFHHYLINPVTTFPSFLDPLPVTDFSKKNLELTLSITDYILDINV